MCFVAAERTAMGRIVGAPVRIARSIVAFSHISGSRFAISALYPICGARDGNLGILTTASGGEDSKIAGARRREPAKGAEPAKAAKAAKAAEPAKAAKAAEAGSRGGAEA